MLPDPRGNANKDVRFGEGGLLFQSKSSAELAYDVEDLKIPWGDLVLKERIGAGIFIWLSEILLNKKLLLFCHIMEEVAISYSFDLFAY